MKLCRMGTSAAVICALTTMMTATVAAQDDSGSVRIPLDHYERLTHPGEAGSRGRPTYAFSNARATVVVDEDGHAEVVIDAQVRVLGSEWTAVPLASDGAVLGTATVDGQPAELVVEGGVLAWPTNDEGTHQLRWTYRADARSYGSGRVLSIATPPAATALTATIPGVDRGVTVLPAANVQSAEVGESTQITASLPASRGAQIAWSTDDAGGFTLSRASYQGRLDGDLVRFEAELVVELSGRQTAEVPLLSTSLALEEVRVDRAEAAIATGDDGTFVVPVHGRGRHRIHAVFQVPVVRDDGLPRIDLAITPTPVSRFELTLPGQRDLTVTPSAGVTVARRDERSVATFHVPMSPSVSMSWSEAIPVDAEEVQTRAHANLVHVVRPDDGVLSMRAVATWEITRGAMSRAELALPEDVQVNSVTSSAGVVSDWRVLGEGAERALHVFLDREVEGTLVLDVRYERGWPARTRTSEQFEVPLLRASGVGRQRGMVALLRSRELTLEPRDEEHMTRVGDNLLPAEVRDGLEGTVAHTWRYLDEPPRLVAIGAAHEPDPARFDAQVDTLVSLGDVSTTVTALIELDVKSGTLDRLGLELPEGLNLLEVSAPSLRRYTVEDGDTRTLAIELTQPMEGRFRVEVVCERITGHEEELSVPTIRVHGAEVERGRLGVEALAAFQVDPAEVERLSPVDPGELPEQLLLRTDNPILHAYRYAQADPAPRFTVRITRHAEIETPHAVIDEASFRTLYTRDGVAVTMARFMVQNRREQFLRVGLPDGSEVWSARVDGRAQTPALEAGSDEDAPTVLLNIVSAAEAFPVEIVYATDVPSLGAFGRLGAELPRLDVVVTRTRWEVFLPEGAHYADPDSTMNLVETGLASPQADMLDAAGLEELRLDVPTEGLRYVFTKMYAGQGEEVVSFSMPYVSGWGSPFVLFLSALGALLFCLGLLAFAVLRLGLPVPSAVRERLPIALATYRDHDAVVPPGLVRRHRRLWIATLGVSGFGAVLLLITHGYLSATAWPALAIAVFSGLGAIGLVAKQKVDAHLASKAQAPEEPGSPATPIHPPELEGPPEPPTA